MEDDEIQGMPVLRDKTETANILALAQKKQKLNDVHSKPVQPTSEPDETDKVTSL